MANFRRCLPAALASLILLGSFGVARTQAQPAPATPTAQPKWLDSMNVAMSEALRTKKLVFVYFRGNSVGACTTMEQVSFAHSAVLREAEKFVMVKQDVEQSQQARQFAAARKVDIQALPAMLILKPDGSEVHRFGGQFVQAAQVYGIMRHVQAWWTAMARTEADPKDVLAFKEAARWQLNLTSNVDALPLLEKVLELDPAGKQVYLNEVYLWTASIHATRPTKEDGQTASDFAKKCINSTLENLNGLVGQAQDLLGLLAMNGEKWDEAAGYFKQMLAGDPDDRFGQGSLALHRLAVLADKQQKTDESVALLERIIQEYPFSNLAVSALNFKARIRLSKDDLDGAIKELERALVLWPNSPASRQADHDITILKQRAATRAAGEGGTTPKAP